MHNSCLQFRLAPTIHQLVTQGRLQDLLHIKFLQQIMQVEPGV